MIWLPLAGLGLVACSSSPAEECSAGLGRLDQLALTVYGRLREKVSERRPGGSADWALAMQKMREARQAHHENNHAVCVENLTQARILLKRASGRY